jgi:aspartyl-tRNA(Asn)/glutamyl-tRNA(Gln) amidotransferase subunit A
VEDAALTFMALQGVDFQDETTLGVPPLDALGPMKKGVKGLRLAFGETLFFDDVDPAVEKAVRGTGEVFRSLGAHVSSQEVPEVREATSNPKRAFFVAAEALIHNKRLVEEHFDELDPVVAHRLATGKELSASDYFVLQRQTADLRRRVVETLRDVDALLVPTLMLPPLPISEIDASPDTYGRHNQKYLRNTLVGNTLNLCAVSVPCGLTAKGLPIGLMVYAKPFQEDVALRVAYAYGQATEWAGRHPDLAWAG